MEYQWPTEAERHVIGKPYTRIDGPPKSTGRAKYTYDATGKNMLFGAMLRSPHAHARLLSVDTSAAEKMPGVKSVVVMYPKLPVEVRWAGDEIAAVAAVDERTAIDAINSIKAQW